MKTFIIQPDMRLYGGAEILIVRLANYLIKKGVDVEILTLSIDDRIKNDLNKNIKIVTIFKKYFNKNYLYYLGLAKLKRYLRNNYENINCVANPHNFPAEYLPIPFAKNIVWMCNEPPMPIYFYNTLLSKFKILDRFLVRKYIKYSIVSDDFNAERFEKIYGIKPKIINYGIDYEFFSHGSRKKMREFILIQVGTITPLKNQIESVKVVEKLKSKIPNIKLLLVGWAEEKYEKFLMNYIKKKKLEKYIEFTGNLDREKVRELYKISDVAIFPVKSQGGWLSPFEALSSGVPIIVSRELTCKDIIIKNDLGIVTNNFSDAVLKIYENKKLYERKVRKARTWIKKNLSWDNFSKKMLEVFEEAIRR